MSRHRRMSTTTHRKSSVSRDIEDTFLGLAFQLLPQPKDGGQGPKRKCEYAIVIHDGTGVVEGETFTTEVRTEGLGEEELTQEVRELSKEVLGKVKDYEVDRGLKVSSINRIRRLNMCCEVR